MSLALDIHPELAHVTSRAAFHMGLTAEYLASRYEISREAQDQYALRSHQRAAAARQQAWWNQQIVPTPALDDDGQPTLLKHDPCVRESSNIAALAALKPAFLSTGGSVTAGNSSPLNDGAAALLVMSEQTCRTLGLRPLAAVRATAVVGVEPSVMGIGPVAAIERALSKSKLSLDQLGFIEINEAFAVQTLACLKLLKLSTAGERDCDERVNAFGGAIAIGHPLGASGARLAMNLALALREYDRPVGVAAMCIGLGQGIATVLERVAFGS
jgi:acetyl-CoA acyltransferase